MLLESQYQRRLIRKIKEQYPGAIVLKNDSAYLQGVPDYLVLYGPAWAALEIKRSAKALIRPNQQYYVRKMKEMSFASFVYPENELEVMDEIQRTLRADR